MKPSIAVVVVEKAGVEKATVEVLVNLQPARSLSPIYTDGNPRPKKR